MKFNVLFVVLFILFAQAAKAGHQIDTLKVAKSLMKNNKFNKAESLLSSFHKTHSDDLNTSWLYGQAAYWARHYSTFEIVYENTIQQFPDNYYLKLDYGLKLLEKGDIQKSLIWLNVYKTYDPTSVDLNLALAKVDYWNGNFSRALEKLNRPELKKGKPYLFASSLKNEILAAKSPWLKLQATIVHDDQPLNILTPNMEAGTYFNSLLSPYLQLNFPMFFQSTSTLTAQSFTIGNKFKFSKVGIVGDAAIGLSHLPSNSSNLIGKFECNKVALKHLELNVGISKQAYLTTISSLNHTVVPLSYMASAGWNKSSSWQGKISYRSDHYLNDKNKVNTFGAWLFAPPLKLNFLQFRFGYSFNYSDATLSRFTSKLTLEELVANSLAGNNTVEGIYNPYFTPDQQQTHSILVNVTYRPNEVLSIGFNGNIGFYGKTNNPYLYLDSNNYGVMSLYTGKTRVSFYPDDVSAYLLYKTSVKSSFKISYSLLRNNFYTCHTAGITYLKSFWNDEKK